MDDEQIRELLAGIRPSDVIPTPPNMTCIAAAAVIEAGGDPAEVAAWVKARRGWSRRLPTHLAARGLRSADDGAFYLVPDAELEGGRAAPATLASAQLAAFMPTTDLERARAFYERALGLKLAGESPIACAFDAAGTTLRVVAVEQLTPHPFTVLGFTVEDIAATIAGLVGQGVAFERFEGVEQDELGVWTSPGGAKVAWFKDPDGNTLSVTQA